MVQSTARFVEIMNGRFGEVQRTDILFLLYRSRLATRLLTLLIKNPKNSYSVKNGKSSIIGKSAC